MAAIYKRELKGYFNTMIGYVIIVFLLAFSGIYFMAYNLNYGYPYFSYVLRGTVTDYEKLCGRTEKPYGPAASDSTGQPVSGCYGQISCNDYHIGNPVCGISVVSVAD